MNLTAAGSASAVLPACGFSAHAKISSALDDVAAQMGVQPDSGAPVDAPWRRRRIYLADTWNVVGAHLAGKTVRPRHWSLAGRGDQRAGAELAHTNRQGRPCAHLTPGSNFTSVGITSSDTQADQAQTESCAHNDDDIVTAPLRGRHLATNEPSTPRLDAAMGSGVTVWRIILDPGAGFGYDASDAAPTQTIQKKPTMNHCTARAGQDRRFFRVGGLNKYPLREQRPA